MLNIIISKIKEHRTKKHISRLIQSGLKIGKNTYILDGAFIDPSHCFLISIGDNCVLAPNVRLIAHDASMKKYLDVAKIGRIKIHDNCFIGDSTIILPGVSIGPNAVIGAGSVVTRNIPPNSVAAGNPVRVITSIDKFIRKHRENRERSRCFSIKQYDIKVISARDKEDMISYLDKHIGYMKGLSK